MIFKADLSVVHLLHLYIVAKQYQILMVCIERYMNAGQTIHFYGFQTSTTYPKSKNGVPGIMTLNCLQVAFPQHTGVTRKTSCCTESTNRVGAYDGFQSRKFYSFIWDNKLHKHAGYEVTNCCQSASIEYCIKVRKRVEPTNILIGFFVIASGSCL